ncbi:hypothetical protein EV677_2374 [Herminiimonas fonticola]|uniref:Uncharacterized protein n=1 Tax=Herminiimonas fonticola TaxID=303380 RepID=A0A4V3BVA3_9BURK|nr:hypothetical protein Hfont_2109 [Herminiimonas fonticola]TDN90298.1 hypothetical protein EV677_2374 [Herminiimonas fonticola]
MKRERTLFLIDRRRRVRKYLYALITVCATCIVAVMALE